MAVEQDVLIACGTRIAGGGKEVRYGVVKARNLAPKYGPQEFVPTLIFNLCVLSDLLVPRCLVSTVIDGWLQHRSDVDVEPYDSYLRRPQRVARRPVAHRHRQVPAAMGELRQGGVLRCSRAVLHQRVRSHPSLPLTLSVLIMGLCERRRKGEAKMPNPVRHPSNRISPRRLRPLLKRSIGSSLRHVRLSRCQR